jgi:hypothetical protein
MQLISPRANEWLLRSKAAARHGEVGGDYDLAASVAKIAAIVTAERRRRTRQVGLADFVNHRRAP